MCLFWKPPYALIQLSCYGQVLTGVSPYHGRDVSDVITDIRAGKRPSHPIDSNQSQLLQDPVWNVIETGWHNQPKRRCKVSVMYRVFSPPSEQQQPGKPLPQIASFFQFLQDSESEIQRQVNEMNEVNLSASLLPLKTDTAYSVLRTMLCQIRSD